MVFDFICKGLLDMSEARTENNKMKKKILPTVEFEAGIFRLRSNLAKRCAIS